LMRGHSVNISKKASEMKLGKTRLVRDVVQINSAAKFTSMNSFARTTWR
jgi:hypothetical protein